MASVHTFQQRIFWIFSKQTQEQGDTKTSSTFTLEKNLLNDIVQRITLNSNDEFLRIHLTVVAGAAMSKWTQAPGKSKPRWAPLMLFKININYLQIFTCSSHFLIELWFYLSNILLPSIKILPLKYTLK